VTIGHTRGRTVLILEDEGLIALEVETALLDAGYVPIVVRSCADASDFLAAVRPDAAVLDIQLSDGDCAIAAQKLVDLEVPFIVHTGAVMDGIDPVFKLGKLIGKPSGADAIVAIVNSLIR
jgi:DNA-binding response OmpR family regulator